MDLSLVHKQLDGIEAGLKQFSEKADAELKDVKKVSTDTQAALDSLGQKQRELAEELRVIKQKQTAPGAESKQVTEGELFVKSASYLAFQSGGAAKARVEVKNTIVGSDTTAAPDRRGPSVGGAFQGLILESFLPSLNTDAAAIEFTKELAFTNAAAEVAEGGAKGESSLTWQLVNMPISTVAHWVRISRQLAMDNKQLADYVDVRMRYGVDLKVEAQLVSGNGVAPAISGFMNTGNFTPHGYADGALGTVLKKLVLIRKVIADLWTAGYPANGIVLSPAEWANIEIDLFTTQAGQALYSVNSAGQPMLFSLPVIQSIGMPADKFAVGNFTMACTVYNREGLTVEMSESDADNFTHNLVTIRAERRLALATERPAAIRGGDLTPAA